ncbi:MAG: ABC transporter substrate-binding protein [Candidatus Rokubacteria bacterium]|nr:ABC transporter substrate-binding protein [Candidatus Rokubacteria bacterium]
MRATRSFVVSVALTLLMVPGLALGAGDRTGVTRDTITVGMFGFYTGAGSFYGTGARDGAMMVINEVNAAGGVHGRTVKVIVEDDRSTPAGSIAAARKLLHNDKVFALINQGGSNPFVATLPILKESNVPVFVQIPSSPKVTRPFHKTIFRAASFNDQLQGWLLADFVMQHLKPARVGILNQSDDYGKVGAQYVIERLQAQHKVTPVAVVEHDRDATDLSAQVLKLREAKPDVVILYTYLRPGAIYLRQAKELGLSAKTVGSVASGQRVTVSLAGEYAEGAMFLTYIPVIEESDDPRMVAFTKKWKAAYPNVIDPGRPGLPDIIGYVATRLFVKAIEAAGPDLTREGLVAALEKTRGFSHDGLMMSISFTPTNHDGMSEATFFQITGKKRQLMNVVVGGRKVLDEIVNMKP